MRYSPFKQMPVVLALSAVCVVCAAVRAQTPEYSDIGRAATQEDIGNLGIASGPSGRDLPPGSGTARVGESIYAMKCAMCHGPNLEGVTAPPGSFSTMHGTRLAGDGRSRLVPSADYVAFVTAILNSIAVEMPFYQPGTLTPDEVYALTAYILFKNGLINEEDVMDRDTLQNVTMPNRDAFIQHNVDDVLDIEKRGCRLPIGYCP